MADRDDQRRQRNLTWGFIAVLGVPLVAFIIWSQSRGDTTLKDGSYSCQPDVSLGGIFYTATIETGDLVDVQWSGMGDREIVDFELGATQGDEQFTASVDGTSVNCRL